MSLSEVRYSSEHIFFYQSQVVIELVAHFSWTWFWFFPKDGNPKQIIGYFSNDSQIILAFSCRRSVLSEKVVQYMVQTIFYFLVISFGFQGFLCWHSSIGNQSHLMNVICKVVSSRDPWSSDSSIFYEIFISSRESSILLPVTQSRS